MKLAQIHQYVWRHGIDDDPALPRQSNGHSGNIVAGVIQAVGTGIGHRRKSHRENPRARALVLNLVEYQLAGLARGVNAFDGLRRFLAGDAVVLNGSRVADGQRKRGQHGQQSDHQHHDGNQGFNQRESLLRMFRSDLAWHLHCSYQFVRAHFVRNIYCSYQSGPPEFSRRHPRILPVAPYKVMACTL